MKHDLNLFLVRQKVYCMKSFVAYSGVECGVDKFMNPAAGTSNAFVPIHEKYNYIWKQMIREGENDLRKSIFLFQSIILLID